MSFSIMRSEGLRGFYWGYRISLMGTIPARALYMEALEVTKIGFLEHERPSHSQCNCRVELGDGSRSGLDPMS
ncbi:hypothetical protein CDL15_Pgr026310 [Punica granatum]|nr:hypothetical protein CDL15_Pgr026310 [Punica granatum]